MVCIDKADESYQKLIKTPKQKKAYAQYKNQCLQTYGKPYFENLSSIERISGYKCYTKAAKNSAKVK